MHIPLGRDGKPDEGACTMTVVWAERELVEGVFELANGLGFCACL
jgi:hypothetical protein